MPLLPILGLVGWILWPAARIESSESVPESFPQQIFDAISPVEAVPVVRADLPLLAEATGHLKPWRQVDLSVEIAGKVIWQGVEDGQRVEEGEVVLRLDDRAHRIKLAEAEADLLKVRANFAVSFALQRTKAAGIEASSSGRAEATEEAEYQRAKELFSQGVIAEKALIRARRSRDAVRLLSGEHQDEVQAATAGLAQAEQQFERARLALAQTRLTAPFAGRVADVEVEVGQRLDAGQRCLVVLDELRMKVDVDVLEADVVRLQERAPARVRVPALQNREFEGTIRTVNPRVDPETGSGRVTVTIPNPGGLLMPGLFAYVDLETSRLEDRLQVPVEAILERQGRQLVFRIEGGRALWTYVEAGVRSGDTVEITEGLNEGDLVAVADHFALAHEAPVKVAGASAGE